MKIGKHPGGLVYSTEGGRMCPTCRKAMALCDCARRSAPRATDGIVRVSREVKGRSGKTVTAISGLTLEQSALSALCKRLKSSCGAGGTVKDGVIEIQGDHCEAVMGSLQRQGWTVERTGG